MTTQATAAAEKPTRALPDWLVRNRNFVLLWAGYGVAAIGDHLSEMALLKERGGLDRPDATRIQALITFGFFLPFVLLGPLAGWWSDRFSRRTTMIVADVVRAIIVFNLSFVVLQLERWLEPERFPGTPMIVSISRPPQALGPPSPGVGDFAIVIPLTLVGILAAFFSPARQAMLPTLIRDDQLVRANAMINALGTIGAILSAVIGGWLAEHAGATWNFHLNALTFMLSATFVFLISMRRTRAVPHPPLEGVLTPVIAGFRYVRGHRRVLQMILLLTVFWAAAGIVISCVPAIVREVFGGRISDAGMYRGIIGIGLATGAAVMSIFGAFMPVQLAIMAALLGAMIWLLLLTVTYIFKLGPIPTGVSLFGIGGAGAALLVTCMATMQRFVPDSRRGRIFGVSDMSTMAAMVIATGAIGLPNIPKLDQYIPYLLAFCATGFAATLAIAWRVYRRPETCGAVVSVTMHCIRFYTRYWCGLKRIGRCSVPVRGPVIVAANHTTGIDPILLLAASPYRLMSFIVAQEHYRTRFAGYFMRLVDCIPVNRTSPGKSVFSSALRILKDGGCLAIFPQGTFEAPDADPLGPKAGIGLIALRSGATVIPAHISGTRYSEGAFGAFLTRHQARVVFGKPIDLSAFSAADRDRAAMDAASALIMQRIRELGEEHAQDGVARLA
ncbi:MAG: MFS transporter [Phycisphaerae bacterium]